MPKGSLNVSLKGADDIFSTEEKRQEEQREQVQQIPIDALHPFTNHPFKVLDDEAMTRTVTTTRSSPGTAASMRLNLPGWIRCRLSCGRCRTMLL